MTPEKFARPVGQLAIRASGPECVTGLAAVHRRDHLRRLRRPSPAYPEPNIFASRRTSNASDAERQARRLRRDDPLVEGVACHCTAPENGGLSGALGLAEQTSDVSLACRQYGPCQVHGEFRSGRRPSSASAGHFSSRRCRSSPAAMRRRNILVYMTYSDKLIDGSPERDSTSSVPSQPWGGAGEAAEMRRFSPIVEVFCRRRLSRDYLRAPDRDRGSGRSAVSSPIDRRMTSSPAPAATR